MAAIDATHDASLESWVASANVEGCDFPSQNLPFGRFSAGDGPPRIGVAIGESILDLARVGLVDHDDMNRLMALPAADRVALRKAISAGLRAGSESEPHWRSALVPQAEATMALPCRIGDYTDFYVGIHHATAVGKLFRPDNPLLPNYKYVPIGYHGRASTIVPSGRDIVRPHGQVKVGDDPPRLAPTARLDFELELGLFVGRGNAMGEPVDLARAEEHLFGVALFNDWSARDIQAWEYQPLGPFLSKSFASTVSPWVVTMEALAPFRRPFARAEGDPAPLPYLDSAGNRAEGAIDVDLEVRLSTRAMRERGDAAVRVSHSNYANAAYWTAAQLVTHHTVNGCALESGDLLGTGTLSGAGADEAGSMLELSGGGKRPIELPGGEKRTFLEDGDRVLFTGRCRREGYRSIGFGECAGTVLAHVRATP